MFFECSLESPNSAWGLRLDLLACIYILYRYVYIYMSSVLFVTSKAFDVMEYTAGWEMGDVISIEDQVDDK